MLDEMLRNIQPTHLVASGLFIGNSVLIYHQVRKYQRYMRKQIHEEVTGKMALGSYLGEQIDTAKTTILHESEQEITLHFDLPEKMYLATFRRTHPVAHMLHLRKWMVPKVSEEYIVKEASQFSADLRFLKER
jgi:hypothetical protein